MSWNLGYTRIIAGNPGRINNVPINYHSGTSIIGGFHCMITNYMYQVHEPLTRIGAGSWLCEATCSITSGSHSGTEYGHASTSADNPSTP